jgi:hypothetical protein
MHGIEERCVIKSLVLYVGLRVFACGARAQKIGDSAQLLRGSLVFPWGNSEVNHMARMERLDCMAVAFSVAEVSSLINLSQVLLK